MIVWILTFALMLLAAIVDIRKKEICAWMLLAAPCLSIGGVLFLGSTVLEAIYALLPGALLLGLGFLSRGGVGFGDGLFVLGLGPLFGFEFMSIGLCLSFFLCGIVSIILLVFKKADRRTELPFLPFLFLALFTLKVMGR